MIPLNTTPVRYVPEFFDAADSTAPVFFLRPGNVLEREMLEAELAGDYRAARVFDVDLARTFAEGIATLMADDPGRDTLLALAAAEAALKEGEQLEPGERQLLTTARGILAEHWPDYRELLAQANRRHQLRPLLAFRRFCVGWENVEDALPFAFGPDRLVTLQAAGSIPPLQLKMAGMAAYRMLYAGGQAKNSEAPSKSGDGPPTSTSGAA